LAGSLSSPAALKLTVIVADDPDIVFDIIVGPSTK